ncbi:ligand-binding sensor domain-containing protein, partial [Rhodohalobacter sulfatireducens]
MRLKNYFYYSLLIAILFCFSTNDLAAQSVNQEIEDTALLLGLETKIPELGPVEIEPIEAPGVAVAEDRHGFMWFGGNDGLYRYDGDEYIHYRHDPYDSTSLSENWVESLHVGSDDMIWIGTFGGGLNRFNPESNTFTHFIHEAGKPTSLSQDTVTVIMEDSQGTVWVGTHGGLNRFDKSTETFTRYLHDPNNPNSLSNNQVRALYEDSEGTIWIGTGSPAPSETPQGEGGLNRFNPESQTFTRFLHNPDDSTSLITNKVMSIYEDSRGIFWVGTTGDGLHSMDRQTGRFTRHLFDPDDPNKLSRPFSDGFTAVPEDCIGFQCGGVTFIHEDHQGMLWIGALWGGIYRYDPQSGAMSHHEALDSGLLENNIWSIHESSDGTLWVGAWSGMHRVFASTNFFPLITRDENSESLAGFIVSAFQEDPDYRIWITYYYSWMEMLNRNTGRSTQYLYEENDPNSLLSYSTIGSSIDQTGNLWITYGNGGLSRYNKTEDIFEHFFADPENIQKFYNTLSIFVDRNDQMWLGTLGSGLYHLDPESETIINNYTNNTNNPATLSNNRVLVIRDAHDGMLWAGTENGLNQIDTSQTNSPTQNKIQRFLQGRIITSLFEDTANRLWVGTWGDGLHLLDPSTGQTVKYNSSDGLPSDKVAAILKDDNGFLWVSTSEGQYTTPVHGNISRFNPKTESFINFSTQEGLPNIGFFPSTALKTHDGLLLFGGNGGYTFFDPSVIREPAYRSPKIALTGFRIFNEEVNADEGGILNRPVYLQDSLELSYGQNDFTFDYTAFAYSTSDQIQYQYHLEPFDTDWVSARSQRSARYSRIPPGEYRFRVRTIDSRGEYSVEEASMDILILPPWWQTWWAYGLYVLLFVAAIFAVDRFQRRRLITKERERARERELEQEKKYSKQLQEAYSELEDSLKKLTAAQDQLVQQEKLASLGQLTAGIAHEIKNPLNFVNNFSDLSIELVEEAREELSALSNQLSEGAEKSPLKGSAEAERRRGVSDEATNHGLILEILDDIEMNLRKIHKHGTRADGIVKSMLQHSRGGSGKMVPTDINTLIKEYTNLAFHGMRAGKDPINVDIELDLDKNVGEVEMITEDFSRV